MDHPNNPIAANHPARRRAFWTATFVLVILAGLALSRILPVGQITKSLTQLSPAPRIGNRMLDFTLTTTTGDEVSTTLLKGNVIIVNFWAAWCPACRLEMPALQDIYDRHREHGLVLLAVDYGEDRETVVNYAREIGISFPLLLDRNATVGERYRVLGLPTTIFVDRRGIIRDMITGGPLSVQYIEGKVQPLLDEK